MATEAAQLFPGLDFHEGRSYWAGESRRLQPLRPVFLVFRMKRKKSDGR